MKKSLVLAMAMALGVTASAYAANPFSDVPAGHWAYDSVAKLADAGVVDGYGDGAFGGDKLLTRYEMAQITAKAMAKGCNVDKLAAEFADELDTLGVRVANLEKKADAVKITGQARFSYGDYDGQGVANLRTRLWVTGQVNEDWTYTGMLQNTQTMTGEDKPGVDNVAGDDKIELKRAYVEGKVGGLDVQAGRWNEFPFTANVLDVFVDGVKVAYGDDVRFTAMAGKGAGESGNAWFYDANESDDRVYMASLEGKVLGANAYAALFKVNGYNANEIWNVGFNTEVAKDLVLSAEYMVGDEEYDKQAGDDGWYADLAWKGADAAVAGSWGAHVAYYDQSKNAYFSPTTDGYNNDVFNAEGGYEGFAYGVSYTFAKNVVGVVNYYDFEGKNKGTEADTIFSEVYFHF